MTQLIKKPIASRAFGSVAAAEGTLQRLRSAGIPNDHVTVICPAKFQHQLSTNLAHVETPPEGTGETITKGGVVGATLGGMALATAALAGLGTGGAALVLIGGGAIAGGFSNLIVSKGYQVEADDHITKAVERGWIVISVETADETVSADDAADGIFEMGEGETLDAILT